MPKPDGGESQEDFVSRCIPIVLEDGLAKDQKQAVAVCNSLWKEESKAMAEPHDVLLNHIRSRSEKKTGFNYGILTADRYVKTMGDLIGLKSCRKHMGQTDEEWNSAIQKAASTLTYSTPEMEVKKKRGELPTGVEAPKNSLMVFRHVLTTSTKDRDGDILRTGGATVDPKMLLLWQHVHTLPIGKMLAVANHTKDELQLFSCIVDMNELCHDAAVMIDNDMGRFSHGFRALDFLEIKAGREGEDSPGGYDVKRYEILEESLVSVPANPDSETQEVLVSLVEGGKLTSMLMKEHAQKFRKQMPLQVPVELDLSIKVNGQEVTKDANESRDKEGGRKGIKAGASKEAGEVPKEGEDEKGSSPEKVKMAVVSSERSLWAGDLGGSWEWIGNVLRSRAKQYLLGMGISVGENEWCSVLGTFKNHVVLCVDRMEVFEYYKAAWSMTEDRPEYKGEPKRVVIETTTEIKEKMKALKIKAVADDSGSGGEESAPPKTDEEKKEMSCPDCVYKGKGKDGMCPECGAKLVLVKPEKPKKPEESEEDEEKKKSFTLEKVGRVLSKANEAKIKDAIEDVAEVVKMEITRPAKALLGQAKRGLSEVITSLGIDDGTGKQISGKIGVKQAMAIVLTDATKGDLDTLKSLLNAFEKREEAEMTVQQFSECVN